MFKKQHRLTSNYEYNITRKHGDKVSTRYFHLFYLKPHHYEGPAKIGIVVSNKFSKTAVLRNRVKRIFREAVKDSFDKIEPNYWLVIHPKYESKDKKSKEISAELNKVLSEISFS